jgi:hypothetical protein
MSLIGLLILIAVIGLIAYGFTTFIEILSRGLGRSGTQASLD